MTPQQFIDWLYDDAPYNSDSVPREKMLAALIAFLADKGDANAPVAQSLAPPRDVLAHSG